MIILKKESIMPGLLIIKVIERRRIKGTEKFLIFQGEYCPTELENKLVCIIKFARGMRKEDIICVIQNKLIKSLILFLVYQSEMPV